MKTSKREEEYKKALLKKVRRLLNQKNINFSLQVEFYIKSSRSRGYVDMLIVTNKIVIPIEIKHDDSDWTRPEIRKQIRKYNRYFKKHTSKASPTMLISPCGRYGMSEEKFMNKLEEIL